jgi:hypothetical protein
MEEWKDTASVSGAARHAQHDQLPHRDPELAVGRAVTKRSAEVQSGASSSWLARKSRLALWSGKVAAIVCKLAIMQAVVMIGR